MKTAIVLGFALLSACSEPRVASKADPDTITINKKYWVCTSSHVHHHDAVELGNAKTIRRKFDAYDSTDCDQWSATFTKPWPACPSTNAWCQSTKPQ